MDASDRSGRRTSTALVGAQMILIAALAWPVSLPGASPRVVVGVLAIAAAVALAFLALAAMRGDTFSVMPEPVAGGRLCRRGPYALVRHPMYSAVLLGGLGAVAVWPLAWKAACLIALAAVLAAKIRREERLLAKAYPEYADYRRSTGALLPLRL